MGVSGGARASLGCHIRCGRWDGDVHVGSVRSKLTKPGETVGSGGPADLHRQANTLRENT